MELKEAKEKTSQRKILIWITIIFALALVLVAGLSYYLVFLYPENQVSQFGITNITEKANFINQYRTTSIQLISTFAQIFGGIAVLIGIYFAWGNLKVSKATLESNQINAEKNLEVALANLNSNQINAEKNLEVALANLKSDQETAQKNIEIAFATLDSNIKNAQKSLEIAQEGQITERFTRAIDQLGAVDHLGNPAMEIRLGGIYALERIANESDKDYWPIMEILTVYVRKNSPDEKIEGKYIDYNPFHDLVDKKEKSKKEKEPLDIQTILTVIGRRKYSPYSGETEYLDLSKTNLRGFNLKGAHLEKADLQEANLQEAKLHYADLQEANLRSADLSGAGLFNVYLNDAHLKGAKLQYATLWDAVLTNANLQGANLKNASLGTANCEGADFGADEDFNHSFWGIDLPRGANLEQAYFSEANLKKANLKFAILKGAKLERANLEEANLENVDLREANLKGAKNLTVDQLSKAKTLFKAQLDEGLEAELRAKGFGHLLDDEPKDEP